MRDNRGSLYLLTGLLLGIVLGLGYAWMFQPLQYTNTSPSALRTDFKDQYRAMIASAYAADNDLLRARSRLALLKDLDPYRVLAEQAQRALAQGFPMTAARALGMLAIALNQPAAAAPQPAAGSPATPQSSASETPSNGVSAEVTSTVTATLTDNGSTQRAGEVPGFILNTPSPITATLIASPALTNTRSSPPLPTTTPTATPGAPFVLSSKELVCDPKQGQDLIKLTASDAAGQPVPGVEAIITWNGGEEHFFTGLKPEISVGYADYTIAHGITYTLHLADGGQSIPNLAATQCRAANGSSIWGAWQLQFVQP